MTAKLNWSLHSVRFPWNTSGGQYSAVPWRWHGVTGPEVGVASP